MAASWSMEQHLDALANYMRAHLQTYMTAEDLLHTDGLSCGTLVSGNVIVGGMWPIPTLTPDNPAIEVAVPDLTLYNFGLDTVDADSTLVFALRAWLQHYGDPATAIEQLYRKALRLGNAINLCVLPGPNDAFGNGAVVQQARSSYRVDPTVDERESFTSSLVMILQVDDATVFA